MAFQRIGELSGLTGIPASTLRFYETHGITQPLKEAQNQYRLYTPQDSCRVLITKMLRSFGCNLDEAFQVVTRNDLPSTLDFLEERERQLDREIGMLEDRKRGLQEHRKRIGDTMALQGRVKISERNAFYRFASISGGQILKNHQLKELSSQWMEQLPFLHYSMEIPVGKEGVYPEDVSWGFSMDEKELDKLNLEIPREAEYFPSSRVVETCLLRESAGFLDERDRDIVRQFREISPCEITGPVVGEFLMICHEDGQEYYLYHLSCSVK